MRLASLLLIAVKAVLLLAGVASGEVLALRARISTCNATGCRITGEQRGSCFTIGHLRDGRVAMLTAAHCIEGSKDVAVAWGTSYQPAEVVCAGSSDGFDVAMLAAPLDGLKFYYPLAADDPPAGTKVSCTGFAAGTRPHHVWGTMTPFSQVALNAQVQSGMSGGLVAGPNREALGVITNLQKKQVNQGQVESATVMVNHWLIRPWLTKELGYVPEPPAAALPAEPTPIINQPANVIGCGCGRPFCLCRPPRPGASTTPAVPPTTPVVPTPSATADNSAVLAEIAALKAAIAAIPAGPRGERGPAGPAGERGPAGLQGPPGETMPAPPAVIATDDGFIMHIKPRDPTLNMVESNLHIVRDGDGYKVRVIYPDGRVGDVETIRPGQRVPVKVFEGAK